MNYNGHQMAINCRNAFFFSWFKAIMNLLEQCLCASWYTSSALCTVLFIHQDGRDIKCAVNILL